MYRVIVFLALLLSFNASAEITNFTGEIRQLVAKDNVLQGEDESFVEMSGFSSAGSCKNGLYGVRAVIRDSDAGSRQFSLLLSAAVSKSTIRVQVDDTYKNSGGYCYLRNVRYEF